MVTLNLPYFFQTFFLRLLLLLHVTFHGDNSSLEFCILENFKQFSKQIPSQTFHKEMKNHKDDNLNNTKRAEIDILVFNRVPKVGSQSLMQLMTKLSPINNFPATKDIPRPHETILLNKTAQAEFANEIINFLPPPYAFSKHLAYINFTKIHLPRPIYINLVRDPIERVISWHYYLRAPWYYEDFKRKLGDKAPPMPNDSFMKMDFETCVTTNDPHCRFYQGEVNSGYGDHRRQTLFFCGQGKKCLPFNSEYALQRAKYTVESEYAVVGTWEDPNITLSVLEAYIPRFFKHARVAYHLGIDKLAKINKNDVKKPVSNKIRHILRKNFTREIEFYEFCKQRLYRQYAAISHQLPDGDDYELIPDN